ncbi:MAG: transglutaminase family protein, partial [Kangiellaceae bacterium]|nr:transglutaminase family protein [Kangiellaceae bacterium]
LARAAGVPARVVVGYQGAEKNPLSDYWIVRYANAHAWTEVWFEGEGWVRIDPTSAIAPERVEEQLRSDYYQRDSLFEEFGFDAVDLENIGWAKNIGFWLDQANTGWNDWVLDYGRDKQKDLFSGLGLSRLNSGQILLVMMLLVGVFLIWISFSFLRARDDIDATERAFRVLVQKLSKAGINCDANTCITQLEHRLMIDENESRCYQSNSLEQIIELLRSYSKIRYQPQANLKIAQKNFQNRVKSLKIQRL